MTVSTGTLPATTLRTEADVIRFSRSLKATQATQGADALDGSAQGDLDVAPSLPSLDGAAQVANHDALPQRIGYGLRIEA
jgi:hypothetical protein